ncbi:hypothetical protein, partial [Brevibacillus reuszeri]|uniref:hypothetical protein n=1 Tax=Brevibacillus reuszeri TaxID=54915 RepID=UPI001F3C4CF5
WELSVQFYLVDTVHFSLAVTFLLLHGPEAPRNDYCNVTWTLLETYAPLVSVALIVTVTVPV